MLRLRDCVFGAFFPLVLVASLPFEPPPLFNITAANLYDAGLQHGQLARDRVQAWLATDEVQKVWDFARTKGQAAYSAIRGDSARAFPQYADELRGIADGAEVGLDLLWAAQMLIELDNLMKTNMNVDHCSDIFAVSVDGYQAGFAHGHNEDWSEAAGELYYYVKYTPSVSADFEHCAGLVYPGSIVGWAPTWNRYGVLATVNTLTPRSIRLSGYVTAFVQRDSICGKGRGRGLSDVITSLTQRGWSDGASINLIDIHARRMANVETYENSSDVLMVTEPMGNYSHFNGYKHLGIGIDVPSPSTLHRQARVDELEPPHTLGDVARILSDSVDKEYPIFRNITIATLLTDGASGWLDVWCCGRSAQYLFSPIYRWNLGAFFDEASEQSLLL